MMGATNMAGAGWAMDKVGVQVQPNGELSRAIDRVQIISETAGNSLSLATTVADRVLGCAPCSPHPVPNDPMCAIDHLHGALDILEFRVRELADQIKRLERL